MNTEKVADKLRWWKEALGKVSGGGGSVGESDGGGQSSGQAGYVGKQSWRPWWVRLEKVE
jgi:hypothetical protein